MWDVDASLLRFLPILEWVLGGFLAALLLATPLLRRKPSLLKEIWLRYASWAAITALVVLALALGREVWIGFVLLLTILVFREYSRAVGLWADWGLQAVVYLFIVLFHFAALGDPSDPDPEPGSYVLFLVLPVWGIVALLAVPIVRGTFRSMLQRLSLSILGLLYFTFFLAHLAFLVNLAGGVALILFVVFLVAINDVAAFLVGKLVGRHPLRPTLSPGKTWEGALGAAAVVVGVGYLLAWLLPPFIPRWHAPLLALLVAVCSVFGDLATSVIKRDVGIKDWSQAIPGHGGVLDRVNSLVFTVPVVFHYVRFFFWP